MAYNLEAMASNLLAKKSEEGDEMIPSLKPLY